jgi:hypothetical protein
MPNSFPVPDGPHNDQWRTLVRPAFAVIDEVITLRQVDFPFQIGGGSMLTRRYRHRKSRDLHLFVPELRYVRWCSPTQNEAAGDLFADYEEDAISLKLVTGMQEVDFIAGASVLPASESLEMVYMLDRQVAVELPREILAKKVIYRGNSFRARDVFDMAVIAMLEPQEVEAVLPCLSAHHATDLVGRLTEIEPVFLEEMANKVDSFPEFSDIPKRCLGIVRAIAESWVDALTPSVGAPDHPSDHRVEFSANGRSVAIRAPAANGRKGPISNPYGPAVVSLDGPSRWFLDGEEMAEEEWLKARQP